MNIKGLVVAAMMAFSVNALAEGRTSYTAEDVGEVMGRHFTEVDRVEFRIQRMAELQNDVALANLKIAAFQVELAKAELEKTIAESALARLQEEGKQ